MKISKSHETHNSFYFNKSNRSVRDSKHKIETNQNSVNKFVKRTNNKRVRHSVNTRKFSYKTANSIIRKKKVPKERILHSARIISFHLLVIRLRVSV